MVADLAGRTVKGHTMAPDGVNMTCTKQERGDASETEGGEATTSKHSSNSSPMDDEQREGSDAGKRMLLPKLAFLEGRRYGSSAV